MKRKRIYVKLEFAIPYEEGVPAGYTVLSAIREGLPQAKVISVKHDVEDDNA